MSKGLCVTELKQGEIQIFIGQQKIYFMSLFHIKMKVVTTAIR